MDGSIMFSRWRQCAPPFDTCFPGPTRIHVPNGIFIGSTTFAQLTVECPYRLGLLYNGPRHFQSKLSLRTGDLDPPSRPTWFLGITRVRNQNGISIGLAVFAGLTIVADRQTDRPRYPSVAIGNICVHSTAMWPKSAVQNVSPLGLWVLSGHS